MPTELSSYIQLIDISNFAVSAPAVNPDPGSVHVRSGSSITLTASIPSVGLPRIEWRLNGSLLTLTQNGIAITGMDSGSTILTTLTISSFNDSTHTATYLLMVQNPAGAAIVAEWHLHGAGERSHVTVLWSG